MNRLIIIIAILCSGFNAISQQSRKAKPGIESIQLSIDATADPAEKIEKCKEAYQLFIRSNPETAFEFARQGLDIAVKEDDFNSQISFYLNLGQVFVSQRNPGYDDALNYFNKALLIARKHNLEERYLLVKHRIANVWIKQNKKDRALILLDSIIYISHKKNYLRVESNAQIELGKLERTKGNYDKSLQSFYRNLEIAEELNNPNQALYTLLQIAIEYGLTQEYQKAIAINNRGLALSKELNDQRHINYFYNNLAVCYRNLKKYDSAFYYHGIVLEQARKEGNPYTLARVYSNTAATYTATGEYDKAIALDDSAFQLVKQRKGSMIIGTIYQNLSELYYGKKDYEKSLSYGLSALEIAKVKMQINEIPNLYNIIYKSYKALNKYDSALYFHEKMTSVNDSIFTVKKNNSIEKIKRRIETAEKQQEITRLRYDKKRNGILLFSLAGALLSSLLIAFLIVKNQKHKKELAEKQQKLEEQKVLTLIQEQEIIAVNSMIKGQEKERQLISEELHDNLGSSLATLKLHIENLLKNKKLDETKKTDILQKTCDILEDTYQKVRDMSHVKSQGMVAQKGLVMALEKLGKQISSKGNTEVHIDVFGFEKIASNPLKILLYNTIQELLTNAIKHAKPAKINIQITRHEKELNVLVEDDGIGFDYSEKRQESGMGLYNIRNKINQLNGTFRVDSSPGHGTTVIINIPL